MDKSIVSKFVANCFSYLFHPLLVVTYAVIIFFNSNHFFSVVNTDLRNTICFLFFILTFLIPVMFIPLVNYVAISSKKSISPLSVRSIILLIVVLAYSVAYYYMHRIQMPLSLINIVLSAIVLSLLCLIITSFWRISIYSSAMGGLLGYCLYLLIFKGLPISIITMLVILCCGIVATSRLYLNKHNPAQVYLGLLLGIVIVAGCMLII